MGKHQGPSYLVAGTLIRGQFTEGAVVPGSEARLGQPWKTFRVRDEHGLYGCWTFSVPPDADPATWTPSGCKDINSVGVYQPPFNPQGSLVKDRDRALQERRKPEPNEFRPDAPPAQPRRAQPYPDRRPHGGPPLRPHDRHSHAGRRDYGPPDYYQGPRERPGRHSDWDNQGLADQREWQGRQYYEHVPPPLPAAAPAAALPAAPAPMPSLDLPGYVKTLEDHDKKRDTIVTLAHAIAPDVEKLTARNKELEAQLATAQAETAAKQAIIDHLEKQRAMQPAPPAQPAAAAADDMADVRARMATVQTQLAANKAMQQQLTEQDAQLRKVQQQLEAEKKARADEHRKDDATITMQRRLMASMVTIPYRAAQKQYAANEQASCPTPNQAGLQFLAQRFDTLATQMANAVAEQDPLMPRWVQTQRRAMLEEFTRQLPTVTAAQIKHGLTQVTKTLPPTMSELAKFSPSDDMQD